MAARYEALLKLASGGMATVWIGTARGALGFRQLVAIKKPHPHLLESPGFRDELIAEARLASMIRHANVVDVRDVEEDGTSLSLVMDFIEGASLGELLVAASQHRDKVRIPARVAVRIVRDACAGLHAAHELVDERSRHVGLVHRDISPQNILVGEDGIARVTDFGVAKFAKKNMQSTEDGSLKGKVAYMAPEYLRGEPIDRRFDIFAIGVVLWEALTGKRCFRSESEAETMRRILDIPTPRLSTIDRRLAPLDDVVACALEKSASARFQNAAAMGAALESAANEAGLLGSHTEVAEALKDLVGPKLEERKALIRSKLAHEPSLASIGGGEVMMSPVTSGLPATPVPDTERQALPPSATVTTEAIAPTVHASPTTTPEALPPTVLAVPVAATDARPPPVDPRFAATLNSASGPPPPGTPRGPYAATLNSASGPPPPAAAPAMTLPLGQLGTFEPAPGPPRDGETTRDASPVAHDLEAVPQPPQRSITPFLIAGGAALALVIGGGVFAMKARTPSSPPPPASAEPIAATSASVGPVATLASATPGAAPSASAIPVATTAPTTAKPRSATPTPATSASAKPKRPPANPYE